MKTFLAGLAIIVISSLVGAWMLMLVVGIAHAEWLPMLPTVGYGDAFVVAIAVDILLAVRSLFTAAMKALVGDES